MNYILVTSLDKYQHYKSRNMVWIKWYIDCLHDSKFMELSPNDKWVFMGIILLACKNDNKVEYNAKWLERTLNVKDIEKSIENLTIAGLIQVNNHKEGAPAINNERDLEDIVFDILSKKYEKLIRQYRIDNSYIDMLGINSDEYTVFELKRRKLSNLSIEQLIKYCNIIENEKKKKPSLVLVGMQGFDKEFNFDMCKKHNISLYIYDNGSFTCYTDVIAPLFNSAIPIREDKIREDKKRKDICEPVKALPKPEPEVEPEPEQEGLDNDLGQQIEKSIEPDAYQDILDYFNETLKKTYSMTPDRKYVIQRCLKMGRTVEQIKVAILNFSEDDWGERHKFCDFIYVIGKQAGKPDNFDRWYNYRSKKTPQQQESNLSELDRKKLAMLKKKTDEMEDKEGEEYE